MADKRWPSRREFLRYLALCGAGYALSRCGAGEPTVAPAATEGTAGNQQPDSGASAPTGDAHLGVARGVDPAAITMAAVAAVGGIERFVKNGDEVIIKPNICVDYHSYEYAATTNPQVVATLVKLCLGAGANRVRVMDQPFGGTAQSAYARSGIEEAVSAAGGEMEVVSLRKFEMTDIPQAKSMTFCYLFQDVLTTDVLINVPIAKHHHLCELTLGAKNLLGIVSTPSSFHPNLGQNLADLLSLVRPQLTVVDAVRTLMAHGPTGGNLDDVKLSNTVIASHDTVAADAFAATLFDLTGEDVPYVKAAAEMGLGTLDLDAIKIEEIAV